MASLKLAGFKPRFGVHCNPHDTLDVNRGLDPINPATSEVPVGKIASLKGKKFLVKEAERRASCSGCDLLEGGICQKITKHPCSAYSRTDRTWVIFKRVTDGTSKQSY